MAFTRAKRQTSVETGTPVHYDSERKLSIDRIILLYANAKQNPDALNHYVDAARDVLWDAIDTYHRDVKFAQESGKRVNTYAMNKAEATMNAVLQSAEKIDFPTNALKPLSFEFIDASLDHDKPLTPLVRGALANLGLVIGGQDLVEDKVRRIAEHHYVAMNTSRSKAMTMDKVVCIDVAESMLSSFGIDVTANELPSRVEDISRFAREHARKAALAGTAALVATSILAPTAANASTRANEVAVSIPETAKTSSETAVTIGSANHAVRADGVRPEISVEFADIPTADQVTVGTNTQTVTAPTIEVSVSTTLDKTTSDAEQVTIGQNVAPNQQTISVKPSVIVDTATKEEAVVNIGTLAEKAIVSTTLAPEQISVPDIKDMVDENGKPVVSEPVAISVKTEQETQKLDPKKATPEQLAIESITDLLENDGDTASAASLIRVHFHDRSIKATTFENGKPVYPTTNADLVDNAIDMQVAFDDLISKRGHDNADYVNKSLAVLSVLEAFGHDQTILNSPDIQKLIEGAKRPEDEYQAKLYDQYLAKAKEILGAEEGKLVKGIDEAHKDQLSMLYTHALLANVTSEQQGKEIQAIKDAEAEAARKAAEEAARQAAEASNGHEKSAEDQAIQNLIDREGDPVSKRAYQIFQFILDRTDLNLAQAAGIVGNLMVESGSSLNPSQHQFNGGPGRGIAQWEGPRIIKLREFAAARGTAWDDFYTQLEFLLLELPGRQNTLEVLKGKPNQYEAARAFMILFETPRVVLDAKSSGYWGIVDEEAADRSSRADGFVNAINGEAGAVNAAREEARIAAEKAAAEAIFKHGPTYEQAVQFASNFDGNRDEFLGPYMEKPGNRVQCTALTNYFVQRYVTPNGTPGHGYDVARNFANDGSSGYSLRGLNDITPYTLFSVKGETYGHTGVILSTNADGSIVVVEANVQSHIQNAPGMLAFTSYGDKNDDNRWRGQVNVEHWDSRESWMNYWYSLGYGNETFASPNDPAQIAEHFKRGAR